MNKSNFWLYGYVFLCVIYASDIHAQEELRAQFVSQVSHEISSNDIWGYVDQNGTEYAVIGTDSDARIYSLEDISNPELVAQIEGAESVWRDYKSYDNYIYQITQRGSDGLTIIDMSEAPDNITSLFFNPTLTVSGNDAVLRTCHNLFIDEEAGIAFLAGCNNGVGGILMFDLTQDPLNPAFIGAVDERYSHDVIVRRDTLFSSEINEGNLGIYDISDPASPQLISRTRTTSSFTHNAWYSDDGRYIFTTDERANSTVDAYDISNINNPILVDTYLPKPNEGIIPHNTHYIDGYLVTSWYTEGIIVIDAHRPDNLVRVAQFDTFLGDGTGFQGCWGAYPYLPSGAVLASDRSNGLFVLDIDYQRASYLEGSVYDAISGAPINGAQITIVDDTKTTELSRADGEYKMGTAEPGNFDVIVSHPDYESVTITLSLRQGTVIPQDFMLFRAGSIISARGLVIDEAGDPIPNAELTIENDFRAVATSTDEDGSYESLLLAETFTLRAAAWGYKGRELTIEVVDENIQPVVLERGFEDDFFVDLGWTISGDAFTGVWERDIPTATFFQGLTSNPDVDLPGDIGEHAYVTGNVGLNAGADDVDNGTTTLTSPPIDVDGVRNPIIEVTPWFFNDGGLGQPLDDTLTISLIYEDMVTDVHKIFNQVGEGGRWREPVQIFVDSIYKRAKTVSLMISVSDQTDSGHLVEAGIDRFRMFEGPTPDFPTNQEEIDVVLSPNPNDGFFYIDIFTNEEVSQVRVFDITGQEILEDTSGSLEVDIRGIKDGTYIVDVVFASGVTTRRKMLVRKL